MMSASRKSSSLNLGLGFVGAKILPFLAGPFAPVYVLGDATLLGPSVQRFPFRW